MRKTNGMRKDAERERTSLFTSPMKCDPRQAGCRTSQIQFESQTASNGWLSVVKDQCVEMINGVETANSQSHPRDASRQSRQGRLRLNPQVLASRQQAQGRPKTILDTLDALEALFRRLIWLPNDSDYPVIVVWALYTHLFDKFMHAPRLALHSPVPGCGKTNLLGILSDIVREGFMVLIPSPAAIFRKMDARHPTMLFDEADKYLYTSNNDVLAVLNAGHNRKSANVVRVMGEDYHVEHYNVFGPMAFALKAKELAADLADRSLRINMQKAPHQMEPFTKEHEKILRGWRDQFVRWAKNHSSDVADITVEMPQDLINRGADNWRPLLKVAKAVGGEWHDRIMAAATAYQQTHESQDRGMLLLSHLRAVWEKGADFMGSYKLVNKLTAEEHWPWGDYPGNGFTTHKLAGKLKHFGIKPDQRQLKGQINPQIVGAWERGYWLKDLEKVWDAYGVQSL